MISDLCVCLLTICISSLEKCLFLFFAHFLVSSFKSSWVSVPAWPWNTLSFFLESLRLVFPSLPWWSGKSGKPHILSTWALLAHIAHLGWIQSISHGQKGRCFWLYLIDVLWALPSLLPLSLLSLFAKHHSWSCLCFDGLWRSYTAQRKCCPYILGLKK